MAIVEQYLVVTCVGEDRPGLVGLVTGAILHANGSLADSRMTVLGGDFAMITLVSGSWDAIAKLEDSLKHLADKEDLHIATRRTQKRENTEQSIPYVVDAVCIDAPGIVNKMAGFFARRGVNIEDLSTNRYAAPHTGTEMFSVHIIIAVPGATHLNTLREEFFAFCDDNNLDAIFEPLKS